MPLPHAISYVLCVVLATLSLPHIVMLPLSHITTLRCHVAGIPNVVFASVHFFCVLFSDNPNIFESEQTTPPISSEYRGSTVIGFQGNRRFITALTLARHWSLSPARAIQFLGYGCVNHATEGETLQSPHPLL